MSFDYAAKQNKPTLTSQGIVRWNHKQIALITPTNWSLNSFAINLTVYEDDDNELTFEGAGPTDGHGLCITNVKLIKLGTTRNIVRNGDFAYPYIPTNQGYGKYVNTLRGWHLESPSA